MTLEMIRKPIFPQLNASCLVQAIFCTPCGTNDAGNSNANTNNQPGISECTGVTTSSQPGLV